MTEIQKAWKCGRLGREGEAIVVLRCEQQRRIASFIVQQALTMSGAKEAPRILLFGDVLGRLDALVKRINTVHYTVFGLTVFVLGHFGCLIHCRDCNPADCV